MDAVGNRSMADLINEKVDQYGDKVFLMYESDAGNYEEYTYRQFDDRINRLANALTDMGVKRGDKVTLMLRGSNLQNSIFETRPSVAVAGLGTGHLWKFAGRKGGRP